jgi:hypothetical protein
MCESASSPIVPKLLLKAHFHDTWQEHSLARLVSLCGKYYCCNAPGWPVKEHVPRKWDLCPRFSSAARCMNLDTSLLAPHEMWRTYVIASILNPPHLDELLIFFAGINQKQILSKFYSSIPWAVEYATCH